jgi:hypothetical protein
MNMAYTISKKKKIRLLARSLRLQSSVTFRKTLRGGMVMSWRKARAFNGKRQGFAQQVPREDFESWMLATNRIPQAAIIRPQARSVRTDQSGGAHHLIYVVVQLR